MNRNNGILAICLWCSSLTNPVTSITLIYTFTYIPSFFITLPSMVHLPFPPSHLSHYILLFMYHHLFTIPPDDDARIGIKTLGNKVSLWLEPKMNSTIL